MEVVLIGRFRVLVDDIFQQDCPDRIEVVAVIFEFERPQAIIPECLYVLDDLRVSVHFDTDFTGFFITGS